MDKTILKNIISLVGIQGANFIIPLITLPYLVRVLEPVGYGNLSFSLALIQYFCILVDYGFNLSATQKIAINKGDNDCISEVFWTTIACKFLLCICGFLFLCSVIFVYDKASQIKLILFSAYITVLGNVIFPTWLFQGKEKMGWSAISNIVARLLSIPFIFLFITTQHDAWLAALINGISALGAGFVSLVIVYKEKWIKRKSIDFNKIKNEFIEGWHVFLSTAAISLYTTSTTVILGLISGPIAVGYYVSADKLRLAAQGLISPISQAFYPRINTLMRRDRDQAFCMIRRLLLILCCITFFVSLTLFLFADFLIKLAYGSAYSESVSVLRWLAWLPFIIGFNNVFGVQTLLVLGKKKVFSKILILSGIFNVFALLLLAYPFEQKGAAVSVFFTELLVTLLMYLVIKKNNIPLFK
ncbi:MULTISPECIES: flippase [unclassified Brenneria]|uniref:flippase n=1 Tax=unclassified Brenneria TaxID=2634434 RepID=UPI0029C433F1|nr:MULTISPECIES: flippase [unclassified Brenneria]MDX5627795.1 flippase [Brenneria sp. L3-3Z]MDX5695114.1 flippase [Brenneria sp. L4-2C]